MKLLEFEAKEIFSKYGIPIPKGEVVSTPAEALKTAYRIRGNLVIKAQIATGGRGKAGGILFADTPQETSEKTEMLLQSPIQGFEVKKVLIEERVPIKRELYFGITADRSAQCYVVIASPEGGIEIEKTAESAPKKIEKSQVHPLYGFRIHHARRIARVLGYDGQQLAAISSIFSKLYTLTLEQDAETAEINPLVETPDGTFISVDARLSIDDNALFRHPYFKEKLFSEERTDLDTEELEARSKGFSYVKLDGEIGVIGNGAGLTMATLDLIKLHGRKAANFLDLTGGATAERVASALKLILSNPSVKVILINILGGITRCDEVAKGILTVREAENFQTPIVVRMIGTNEEKGRRILNKLGIEVLESLEEAVERASTMDQRS